MRWTIIAAIVLTAGALQAQEDTLGPKQSWDDMEAQLRELRDRRDYPGYRALQQSYPKEFLAKWESSGAKVEGEERLYLGMFLARADRPLDALAAYLACANDAAVEDEARNRARMAYARGLPSAVIAGKLGGEPLKEAIATAASFLDAFTGDEAKSSRATIHQGLASAHELSLNPDAAIEHRLEAARCSPGLAAGAIRSIVSNLMTDALDPQGHDKLRTRAKGYLDELTGLYEGHVERMREGGNAQAIRRAESTLQRMPSYLKALELLGQPAPEWTLEHAYGNRKKLEDYKGKVVILDFWATWCPWCIRSFPALRDLLKDYKEKDLALVGVTASANVVYDARYDLDEDLKDKATEPAKPALRRDPSAPEEEQKRFREQEKEIIERFMRNHEMTWDVVMIDKTEPSAKYALQGWPHAVVLDRQGRMRYFKSGALLRDRPEAVKKFRKILDALLAEAAD